MSQGQLVERKREFLPSLEGVRGYGFLLIFFAHYAGPAEWIVRDTWWLYPLYLFWQIAWIMVPAFFVLSGYLICGILMDTRDKQGYFKVFYARRMLRVLPIYYLTLVGVGIIDSLHGMTLSRQYWSHYFYIHNLLPGYRGVKWIPADQLIHLWSMGVEEQFYLVWPVIVWLCRKKETLLRVTFALIGVCFALRLAAPLIHLTPSWTYYWTPTRADAILIGAVLAMIRSDEIYIRIEPYARNIAFCGIGALMLVTIVTGQSTPSSYWRCAVLIPLANIAGAALLVAVKQEGTVLYRVCSTSWINWMGSRSYALYLFHLTYSGWFSSVVFPWFTRFMPYYTALMVSIGIALAMTLALGELSYRLVESPAMNLKRHFKYGPGPAPSLAPEAALPVAAEGLVEKRAERLTA